MALSVDKIEKLVRQYANDTTIVISAGVGIVEANSVYRRIAAMYQWPELRNAITSFSLLTLANLGIYNWFIMDGGDSTTTSWAFTADGGDSTTTSWAFTADDSGGASGYGEFFHIIFVEVETALNSGIFNTLIKPKSESHWNEMAKDNPSIPVYYMRKKEDGNVIELRPKPNYTGGKLKITGYLEPNNLVDSKSETIFLSTVPDYAFAKLIAADYLLLGDDIKGHELKASEALNILKEHTVKEKIPERSNV